MVRQCLAIEIVAIIVVVASSCGVVTIYSNLVSIVTKPANLDSFLRAIALIHLLHLPFFKRLEVFLTQMLHLRCLVNEINRAFLVVVRIVQIGLSLERPTSHHLTPIMLSKLAQNVTM